MNKQIIEDCDNALHGHRMMSDCKRKRFYEPRHEKTVFGVSDQVRHNQAVQPLKTARALKFRMSEVEGLYYLCSENKGTDQLCSYCTAYLRLCFCIGKKPVFS